MGTHNVHQQQDELPRSRPFGFALPAFALKLIHRPSPRAASETALIIAALVGALVLLPHTFEGDGAYRFAALKALLTGASPAATKYSLLGPIFAAPLWWLGELLATPAVTVGWFNTLIFGLGLLGLYLLLRRCVEGRLLRAFLLLLSVASMVPYHLIGFYGEVFTAVLVATGLTAAVLSARMGGRLAGWALVALGVANTPATIAGLLVVVGQRVWVRRRLRYALAIVGALALVAGMNLLQRGSLTNTGYQDDAGSHTLMPFSGMPGFSYPLLLGLLSILFSFGKGLIFFTPGLFLPMRLRMARMTSKGILAREVGTVYALWIGFTVGLILVYSTWWAWYGGWFWGPRFFLFACIPASFALAVWTQHPSSRLWVNLLALGALALSTWVGIDGVVFGQSALGACTAHQYQFEAYCHYTPDFSALWRPMVSAYLYGVGPRFAAIEQLQPSAVAYGVFIAAVGAYLSIPLLGAIARQIRVFVESYRALLSALHHGWRF